jgi:hypothetical protein
MHRRITYSSQEFYYRYLSLGLNNPSINKMCNGNFLLFLKNELHLTKLPYDLKLIDLIIDKCFSTELFVELPPTYFTNWKNYPFSGSDSSSFIDKSILDAGFYDLHIQMKNEKLLSELSHPYDEQLNKRFKKRFEILPPKKLIKYEHPNGRSFYPNEAYLAYWKGYIILEAVNECVFIDKYLPPEKGENIFKENLAMINERWTNNFKDIFNAISHYRTFIAQYHHLTELFKLTDKEISEHLLKRANISVPELYSGLGKLLELHKDWTRKLENNGLYEFNFALKSLKRDIYFLFEWLRYTGYSEQDLIKHWTNTDRQAKSWTELKDVLDFEEIYFKTTFERFTPIYCKLPPEWLNLNSLPEVYEQLKSYKGFKPWIRAFADLHETINNQDNINLKEPRLLDTLLVLTIRSEVLIRTMFISISEVKDSDDFKKVLKDLASMSNDSNFSKVLDTVVNNIKELTKLKLRPESMFEKIEKDCTGNKSWPEEDKHFFKAILKFITARNYFAHHYYKDDEFNHHTNKLCGDVVTNCLQTILYINNKIKTKS